MPFMYSAPTQSFIMPHQLVIFCVRWEDRSTSFDSFDVIQTGYTMLSKFYYFKIISVGSNFVNFG